MFRYLDFAAYVAHVRRRFLEVLIPAIARRRF